MQRPVSFLCLFTCSFLGLPAMEVVRLDPSAYRAVFAPSEALTWTVELTQAGTQPAPATSVAWTLRDVEGTTVGSGKLAVPALAASASTTLKLDAGRRPVGWWRLSLATSDDLAAQPTRYAVVLPPEIPKDQAASRFGINLHSMTDDAGELPLMKRMGIAWLRSSHNWHMVQAWKPEEDWRTKSYDWAPVDAALDQREKLGLRTMGSFGFSVACASSTDPHHKNWWGQSFAPPDDRSDNGPYFAYTKAVVEHCQGRIHFWEQWNEPDLGCFFYGDEASYAETLACAKRGAQAGDPNARVLNGGWSGAQGLGRIDRMLAAGATPAHDVIAFHDYNSPIGKTQAIKRAYRRAGAWPRPLWNTEVGKEPELSEDQPLALRLRYHREHSAEMVRALTLAAAQGVERSFWFCWAWSGYAMHTPIGPRPVVSGYRALADLIDAPTPAKPLGTVDLGPAARGSFAFAFERPDGLAVVAWRDPSAAASGPQRIELAIGAGDKVVLQGSDGRDLPAPVKAGRLTLTLTDEPLLVRLIGPGVALRKTLGWTRRYTLGEGVIARADLGNPAGDAGLHITTGQRGVTIAGRLAGGTKSNGGNGDYEKFYVMCNLPVDLAWEIGDEFGLPRTPLRLRLTYLDSGKSPIGVQYGDGLEMHIPRTGTDTWKTTTVDLPGGVAHSFWFHCNLRLCSYGWAGGNDLVIERLELLQDGG